MPHHDHRSVSVGFGDGADGFVASGFLPGTGEDVIVCIRFLGPRLVGTQIALGSAEGTATLTVSARDAVLAVSIACHSKRSPGVALGSTMLLETVALPSASAR